MPWSRLRSVQLSTRPAGLPFSCLASASPPHPRSTGLRWYAPALRRCADARIPPICPKTDLWWPHLTAGLPSMGNPFTARRRSSGTTVFADKSEPARSTGAVNPAHVSTTHEVVTDERYERPWSGRRRLSRLGVLAQNSRDLLRRKPLQTKKFHVHVLPSASGFCAPSPTPSTGVCRSAPLSTGQPRRLSPQQSELKPWAHATPGSRSAGRPHRSHGPVPHLGDGPRRWCPAFVCQLGTRQRGGVSPNSRRRRNRNSDPSWRRYGCTRHHPGRAQRGLHLAVVPSA